MSSFQFHSPSPFLFSPTLYPKIAIESHDVSVALYVYFSHSRGVYLRIYVTHTRSWESQRMTSNTLIVERCNFLVDLVVSFLRSPPKNARPSFSVLWEAGESQVTFLPCFLSRHHRYVPDVLMCMCGRWRPDVLVSNALWRVLSSSAFVQSCHM